MTLGKAPITLAECIEIKNVIGKEYTIGYLFAVDRPREPV